MFIVAIILFQVIDFAVFAWVASKHKPVTTFWENVIPGSGFYLYWKYRNK